MYALEPEPEKRTRGRRLLIGVIIAVSLAGGLLVTARYVEPAKRLLPEILQIAVIDDPPPKQEELPPPPPPPPPPPKQEKQVEEKTKPVEQKDQEKQAEPDPNNMEPQVGLDASSFAGGGNGVAFRTGTTQMGDPNRPGQKIDKPVVVDKPAKLSPAHALNPAPAKYPERARRRNVEGTVVLEADINERGKLVDVRLRQGRDPDLDEVALSTVKRWKFQPATLDGRAVPSTRLIQIEFALN